MGCMKCGTVNLVTIQHGEAGTSVPTRDERAPVARFFSERVELAAGERVDSHELFTAYVDWCAAKGGPRPTPQAFGRAVVNLMGLERYRSNGKRYYLNVVLRD